MATIVEVRVAYFTTFERLWSKESSHDGNNLEHVNHWIFVME